MSSVRAKTIKPILNLACANLFSTYTKSLNKNYQRTGSLFEKPFKRILIDSDRHFIHLISYIHRDPQKHGFEKIFAIILIHHIGVASKVALKEQFQGFGTSAQFEKYHQQFDEATIQHLIKS